MDVIETVVEWVSRILRMFGLGEGFAAEETSRIGWGKTGQSVTEVGDVSHDLMLLFRP